ncbi:hypothetical protein GOBAR_DD32343 [Gossypium barbadense]|nr:hypothetical protein GOBAR_DD32343 [Gossypium barbadense]
MEDKECGFCLLLRSVIAEMELYRSLNSLGQGKCEAFVQSPGGRETFMRSNFSIYALIKIILIKRRFEVVLSKGTDGSEKKILRQLNGEQQIMCRCFAKSRWVPFNPIPPQRTLRRSYTCPNPSGDAQIP